VSRSIMARGLWGLVLAGTVAGVSAKPHEHGVVKLDVALDGNKLSVALQAPLDNLLGFERAPRNDAERQAAAALLARLRSPDKATALFAPDAAAQCVLAQPQVQAAALEPITKRQADNDHADLDATYEFSCTLPTQLRALTLGLFDAFPRLQRVDVQVVGPKGQAKTTLKRPAKVVKLLP
jgi:hypothetical protein